MRTLGLTLVLIVTALILALCFRQSPGDTAAGEKAAGAMATKEKAENQPSPSVSLPGSGGPLGHLMGLRPGRSARVSSAAATRASNWDNRRIAPGKTLVLADIAGPGHDRAHLADLPRAGTRLAGQGRQRRPLGTGAADLLGRRGQEPAVESPIGDFFAAGLRPAGRGQLGHGGRRRGRRLQLLLAHAVLQVGADRDREPERQAAGLVLLPRRLPARGVAAAETPYFCAEYRQEFPTQSGRDYLILDAVGRGHYVGTVLSARLAQPRVVRRRGREVLHRRREDGPSLWGTGTEDYVCNAWGMGVGTFPYFGVPILEGEWGMVGWRTSVYRWHVPDPVRFTKSLRVEIENAGWICEGRTEAGQDHEGIRRAQRRLRHRGLLVPGRPAQAVRHAPAGRRAQAAEPRPDRRRQGRCSKTAKTGRRHAESAKGLRLDRRRAALLRQHARQGRLDRVQLPRREGGTPAAHAAHDVAPTTSASTASCSTARRSASAIDFYSPEVKVPRAEPRPAAAPGRQAHAAPGVHSASAATPAAASWASTPSACASDGT